MKLNDKITEFLDWLHVELEELDDNIHDAKCILGDEHAMMRTGIRTERQSADNIKNLNHEKLRVMNAIIVLERLEE